MRLGIGTWAYPWSIGVPGYPPPGAAMDALALVRKAHNFGLHLVQICDNLPYYDMSRAELESLHRYAEGLDVGLGLGTRGVAPEHLLEVLDYARPLHADTLRAVIDVADPARVAEGLKGVVPALAEARTTLILENTEILDARDFAAIVRAVDSPLVRVCLDTANALGRLQTLDQVVAALGPYVRMIHYKDFAVQRVQQAPPVVRMGFEVVGRVAGEGWVDCDWLLRAVLAAAPEAAQDPANPPDVVLEQWPPLLETMDQTVRNEQEWVERSVAFLKTRVG